MTETLRLVCVRRLLTLFAGVALMAVGLTGGGCSEEKKESEKPATPAQPPAMAKSQKTVAEPQDAGGAEPVSAKVADRISQADLLQWITDGEGVVRITELMREKEASFSLQVKAVVLLVRHGHTNRIRRIVSRHLEPERLGAAVGEQLIAMLGEGNDESASQARDGLLILLPRFSDALRDRAQQALAAWAFKGVTADKTREEVWELVGARMYLAQIGKLGRHGVEPILLMIEKRVESESFTLYDWIRALLSIDDGRHAARGLQAIRRCHEALFANMEVDEQAYFPPNDIILIEKFNIVDTPLYLLELSLHDKLDPASRYEALLIAEAMFDKLLTDEELAPYLDRILPVIIKKLPDIRDASGQGRMKQAQFVLDHSGIEGLKDVALTEEKEVEGETKTSWKPYMASRLFHPGKFMFGVAGDFLQPLVDSEREKLAAEWRVAGKEVVSGEALAGEPEFRTQLAARVDRSVTPLAEGWLKSKVKFQRLFAVAGLKFLGTPGAITLLTGLVSDKTDFSDYMDDDTTMSKLAGNALKGIELSAEFGRLELDDTTGKVVSNDSVKRVHRRMLQDLSLSAEQLEEKYRADLKKERDRYQEQKRKLAELIKKYRKAVNLVCYKQVEEYPPLADRTQLQNYIEKTAVACRAEAEEKLNKKKLDLFLFTEESYRSAVILAILKKEIVRKFYIKAKARAYLRAAVEARMEDGGVQRGLAKVERWKLDDAGLRKIIDSVVSEALAVAVEDHKGSKGEQGIPPADIKEYREYLELPEKYVLGSILLLRHKLEWTETDAKGEEITRSLLAEAATAAFNAENYFGSNRGVSDFLMENYYDAWYVAREIGNSDEEATKKRWAISDTDWAGYAMIAKDARGVVDVVTGKWVADGLISAELLSVLKDSLPLFEIVTDAMFEQFEVVRKKRLEEKNNKSSEPEGSEQSEEGVR